MEKIDRVRHALVGGPVDRPPISFWRHNFAREHSAEALAEETVEQFRRYDWDFIKIQSRATAFAEGWGVRYTPSTTPHVPPVVTEWPVNSAADLGKIRPIDPRRGVLGEQLAALRLVRQAVGTQVPILQTVFAPSMVLPYLLGPEAPQQGLLEVIRRHAAEVCPALAAIRETMSGYARECLSAGADGIFFSIKAASADQMTRAEYSEFGLPYDGPVLAAAAGGWLNMLHLCGPRLYFDIANDLPTPLINWALDPGNPGLASGREQSRRAVIGGVSPKPRIREMSAQEVAAEVTGAVTDTAGVSMMVGPGCSISPDTPDENLRAVRPAVETSYAAR